VKYITDGVGVGEECGEKYLRRGDRRMISIYLYRYILFILVYLYYFPSSAEETTLFSGVF
jgi:hypothetical protein